MGSVRWGCRGSGWSWRCEILEKCVETFAIIRIWCSKFLAGFEGCFGVLDDRRCQLDRAGVRHGGIRHSGAVVILLSLGKTVVGLREQ